MKIMVNGASRETAGATLETVLDELGFADSIVATALNGDFVAIHARPTTALREGDCIEILAPLQGG